MSSGGMRKLLSYLPFTFTEQGQMDEEFNAFAETAARAALKAAGEVRPTDADVKGMKQAMFGVGRDEQVNMNLLKDFINSIERDNHEAYILGVGGDFMEQKIKSEMGVTDDDIETTMRLHGMDRKSVVMKLWEQRKDEGSR